MDMTGRAAHSRARGKVWDALNDPAVLKTCIPGCETLVREADDTLAATASVKIGPITAKFSGRVQLLDLDPPNGYRIQGEGAGGVAGFAKGGATVNLADEGVDTLLRYEVQAQVGGKIAQLGARLIDATAKSMAETFFTRFAAEVGVVPPEAAAETPIAAMPIAATQGAPRAAAPRVNLLDLIPSEPLGFPIVAWIGCGLFAIIFILIFGSAIL